MPEYKYPRRKSQQEQHCADLQVMPVPPPYAFEEFRVVQFHDVYPAKQPRPYLEPQGGFFFQHVICPRGHLEMVGYAVADALQKIPLINALINAGFAGNKQPAGEQYQLLFF